MSCVINKIGHIQRGLGPAAHTAVPRDRPHAARRVPGRVEADRRDVGLVGPRRRRLLGQPPLRQPAVWHAVLLHQLVALRLEPHRLPGRVWRPRPQRVYRKVSPSPSDSVRLCSICASKKKEKEKGKKETNSCASQKPTASGTSRRPSSPSTRPTRSTWTSPASTTAPTSSSTSCASRSSSTPAAAASGPRRRTSRARSTASSPTTAASSASTSPSGRPTSRACTRPPRAGAASATRRRRCGG